MVAQSKDKNCNPIPEAAPAIVGAIEGTVQAIHNGEAKPGTARAFYPPISAIGMPVAIQKDDDRAHSQKCCPYGHVRDHARLWKVRFADVLARNTPTRSST